MVKRKETEVVNIAVSAIYKVSDSNPSLKTS
jgi:hypothetical protein